MPCVHPALDCPILFTIAPNAAAYSFLFTTIGTLIVMLLWPLFALPMVIPGIIPHFPRRPPISATNSPICALTFPLLSH